MNVKETIIGTETLSAVSGEEISDKAPWGRELVSCDQGWITVIIGRCGPQQLVSQRIKLTGHKEIR